MISEPDTLLPRALYALQAQSRAAEFEDRRVMRATTAELRAMWTRCEAYALRCGAANTDITAIPAAHIVRTPTGNTTHGALVAHCQVVQYILFSLEGAYWRFSVLRQELAPDCAPIVGVQTLDAVHARCDALLDK